MRPIEDRPEWGLIRDTFEEDLFPAEEVVEICEDWEMSRVEAVVMVSYYIRKNGRTDSFELNCDEALKYFYPNGDIKTELFIYDYP